MGVFAIGLFYYCFSITGLDLEFVPGDLGDSRFINYLLEHGYQYLCGNVDSFWSPAIMYPTQNALAFSDNMMGSLPLYGFFRVLQCDIQTSYQLWWMSVCALNYFSCFYILNKWCKNPYLAACAAFVFAFGLFNQSQMSYLQMNTRFMVPFVFWFTWLLFTKPSIRNWIALLACIVVQFYLSIYLGFLVFYSALLFAVVLYFVYKPSFFTWLFSKTGHWIKTLVPALVAIGFLVILLLPYYRISSITGLRMYNEVVPSLAKIDSYFFAHESSITWRFLSSTGKIQGESWWLQNIMPGLIPFMTFVASGLFLLRQKMKKLPCDTLLLTVFITSSILFLLFTRTSDGLSLYAVVFKLPGMNSMRVLTRFMHVELFLLLLLLVTMLNKIQLNKYALAVYASIFLIVWADNLFEANKTLRTAKQTIQTRHSNLEKEVLQGKGEKRIFALTSNENACYTHLDAMYVGLALGMPTINGYSSYCENDFGDFFRTSSDEGLEEWMKKRGIDSNVVYVIRRKR